jgi:hypothetical protein
MDAVANSGQIAGKGVGDHNVRNIRACRAGTTHGYERLMQLRLHNDARRVKCMRIAITVTSHAWNVQARIVPRSNRHQRPRRMSMKRNKKSPPEGWLSREVATDEGSQKNHEIQKAMF